MRAAAARIGHHRGDESGSAYRRIARASSSVIRGLRAHQLELLVASRHRKLLDVERVGPRLIENCLFTDAFSPWISDTTAMIEVTATMLPSTVMQRPELGRPDRAQRDAAPIRGTCSCVAALRLEACAYLPSLSTFTGSPSAMRRGPSCRAR